MAVHFHKKQAVRIMNDNRADRATVVMVLRSQDETGSSSLGDIIAGTNVGQVLADIQKTAEAQRAERAAAHRVLVNRLQSMARSTFSLLRQEGIVDRLGEERFEALAWGSDEAVADLQKWLRHGSYDSRAYVQAYERLTGRECRFIPPALYRNKREFAGQ